MLVDVEEVGVLRYGEVGGDVVFCLFFGGKPAWVFWKTKYGFYFILFYIIFFNLIIVTNYNRPCY